MKIHQLPPNLIAQIAAGEVIERPSYAVKELIDNALDAGATTITVSIENSGLKKIVVQDNGEGMSKDDLLEAVKIHTTSKVLSEDSLTAISSLGFRGEALASIASISHLTIKSKCAEDLAGNEITINNGKFEKITPIGMPQGTVIEVSNIFSQIPARKKFLKSPQTELRHIIDVFISFSLAFPTISFSLTHNNKKLFLLPKTEDLLSRIQILLGQELVPNLVPLTFEDSYLKVKGYLAKPQHATTTQSKQYIFVNNRRISDKLISLAAKDAYQNLLDQKHYPIILLYLTIPYELVDVNVHPRKEQLGFANNQLIYDTILKATQQTLSEQNLTFGNISFKNEPITASFAGQILKKQTIKFHPKAEKLEINFKSVSQLHNLYLVAETKTDILFIDQHAAHERILYEQFKKQFTTLKNKSIKLPSPLKTNFKIDEKLLIDEYRNQLRDMGLIFDKKTDELTHIPLLFKDRNLPLLIKELLENLAEKESLNQLDQTSHKLLQFLACKSAIKAGDPLTTKEAVTLIKKLEQTENNSTCPHSRPTKYLFPLAEINKLFKR